MITWDDPDSRYYQHGLDRGVLYPRNLPVTESDVANNFFNPSTENGSTAQFSPYGMNTKLDSVVLGNGRWLKISKTAAGSQMGFSAGLSNGAMTSWPADTLITISAYVINPVGSTITSFGFVGRDDGNNDSYAMGPAIDGAYTWNVPPDGVERRIFLTAKVLPNRNVERIYVYKNTGTAPLAEVAYTNRIMVNYGTLTDFFDGNTPENLYRYEWGGDPYASPSYRYPIIGRAIPFNGLTGFDEGSEGGDTTVLYRDGVVYLADVEATDFSGKLRTLFYPDEFAECVGIPKVADGLYIDNQKPQPFDFSYRTLVGSGTRGDLFGYQIHLVYNCMPSIGSRSRQTIGSETTPLEFVFDLACTPIKLPGFRPSAHYIIDTRNMAASTIAQLEEILYGSSKLAPRMPTPQELYDLMHFGDSITVVVHNDGTYTVSGSNDNVEALSSDTFIMRRINGFDNGDGTYVIRDGGSTDVIIET